MAFSDVLLSLFIVFIFIGLYAYNVFSISVKQVQDNWPQYRCNPMYMPFSEQFGQDPMDNFSHCVHSMTKGIMSHLMEPMEHIANMLSNMGAGFQDSLNNIRHMFSNVRDSITGVISSVFAIFLSILIEIQKMIMSIKDLMGKTVGMLTTMMFMMDGTVKTMESAWNGPPGGMVRSLCFHPNTTIQLNNGTYTKIKNLNLGDVLKGGSVVEATLKLRNVDNIGRQLETLYQIDRGEKMEKIYVTGKHFIKGKNGFIYTQDHPDAKLTLERSDVLYSLITSDNKIRIGDRIFWDWEDDDLTAISKNPVTNYLKNAGFFQAFK